MAEDDIYGSKARFEAIRDDLEDFLAPPGASGRSRGSRRYWIKNPVNLQYFRRLLGSRHEKGLFDARDTSYIRRLRIFRDLLLIAHFIEKDFALIQREDIDRLVGLVNDINRSSQSKRTFILDLKFLWKHLFPERDERGRVSDDLVPYTVRHLSGKSDKSREKLRGDKFSPEEFERLVAAFSNDVRMQCLLTVALESLSRPQELLGRRIRDVELSDNYAKIYISEHGKEGVGFLRVIDSYPYLVRWLEVHPLRKEASAFLYLNTGQRNHCGQLKPPAANKLIKERLKILGIKKPITLYSLKRNGVTLMRLAGKSDLEIQHTARWTSTRQLATYDLSNQEESFKQELIKRGVIDTQEIARKPALSLKTCGFCNTNNGLADAFCSCCKRPLDRATIEEEIRRKDGQVENFTAAMRTMLANQERLEMKFARAVAAMQPDEARKKLTPELVKKFLEADYGSAKGP